MATVSLSKEACQSNGITLGEALLLLAIHNEADLAKAQDALVQKGFITASRNNLFQPDGWRLTSLGSTVLDNVILDATTKSSKGTDDALLALARELKAIFPKGKRPGGNQYWAEGEVLIVRRLKLFFKKYGDNFDHQKIIQAAKDYVTSFNGNYTYMRTLKYFIFKEERGANGEVEGTSDLITKIENAGQEDVDNNDWTVSLR